MLDQNEQAEVVETEQKADAEEERKDRARGERKVRGPTAALSRIREAIASSRQFFAAKGESLSPGTAWSRVGDHYIARWEVSIRDAD